MSELFFGGPDRPPRLLRNLLERRVEETPAGATIDWATYYFRDTALAHALMAASDRGVRVSLHVEGSPRRPSANRNVLDMLSQHGLAGGLHVHRPGRLLPHPHLHTKIYAFSGPHPAAFVGSFNPSGDVPEEEEVIAEIGDQDRGHNLLVEYRNPQLVEALSAHVRAMRGGGDRFRSQRTVHGAETSFFFYPRLRTGIIDRDLAALGKGSRVRGAISHLKKGFLASGLAAAARRGAQVDLIVHDTERRVPSEVLEGLREAGVAIRRYAHPLGYPQHAKFLLTEASGHRTAWFGSFNFNPRSRYLNHELLVRSREDLLWRSLSRRFEQIAAEDCFPGTGTMT